MTPFFLFLFGRELPKDKFCKVWENYYCQNLFVKTWKFGFQASIFYSRSATLAPPILSAGLVTPFFIFFYLEENYRKINSAKFEKIIIVEYFLWRPGSSASKLAFFTQEVLLWRHLSCQQGWWPPFSLFLFGRELPKDKFCQVWENHYCQIFFVKTWKFSFRASIFYSRSATLAPPILSAGLVTPFFSFFIWKRTTQR